MKRYLCILLGLLPLAGQGADQNAAEAKLRESLRGTMLQLRTIQGERDQLQADKTQLEAEKKDLTSKVQALTKQAAADKDASDKAIAKLTDKADAQEKNIAELKTALEKWKLSQQEAVNLAKSTEEKRATLAAENVELKRKVADQQRRNLAMYKVGTEILSRYEKFGLGTAITAKEPFTGSMRVRLENLVQDYSDKLDAERLKSDAGATQTASNGAAGKKKKQ
jgi:hypothetical protein